MNTHAGGGASLVDWGPEHNRLHDTTPFVTPHRLHETGLFTDEALARLIDRYKRERLQVFTMGTDPLDNSQWGPVDTTGASGAEILRAVAAGRLWVKLMRIDLEDREYMSIMEKAYQEVWSACPDIRRGYLRPLILISSPGALVYYHADAYATMLWHVRGSKRVWIYPAADSRFIDPDLMESIYAGEIDEEVPYRPDFDRHATVFDLQPGQLLTWPLNAPHRIVNHDSVNVSVSVQYSTSRSDRRSLGYLANRFLRSRLHLPATSVRDDGAVAAAKRLIYRVSRKLNLTGPGARKREYLASYRIDATSTIGMTPVAGGPVRTPF